MTDIVQNLLPYVVDWSNTIFDFIGGLDFQLPFGDALLSFLLECLYSFSVAFIFVLPFIIVYHVIKFIIR